MIYNNLSEIEYFLIRAFTNYAVFINSLLIFFKTRDLKVYKKRLIIVLLINVIISILNAVFNDNSTTAQTISFLGITLSFTILDKRNKTKSILIAFISISFAHVFKIVSLLLTGTVFWAIQIPLESIIPYFIEDIVSILFTFLFLKIKRFKNGIIFFEKEENLGLGLIISGIVFIISAIDFSANQKSIPIIIILSLGIFISGFGLYLWIRKGITKHYRERLQLKSEMYYKEQLEQKETEIEQLNRSNEYMSKIVHRDNHLMSSLSAAIDSFKQTKSDDDKEKLLDEVQTLINERRELIYTEQRASKIFPSTGNALIDGAVNDLYIKAAAHGIDFNLTVSKPVDEIIGKYISQTDLQTLICDHIKDAIIAVDAKNENGGKILVDLSMDNDNYSITVFDSGVDFELDTLAKLGKERVTTHAENGGSGIGFMTTFETLRKSYASLIITEFENKAPFSKSVAFRFDGNTAFIIKSYRNETLKSAIERDDVIITI